MVTVITACFNAARHLESALESLHAQSYRDFEHIVIDGGSRDGTVDIIKRHADKIAYWVSEPDRGLADAWNKGIQKARGGVIGLLNADDLYAPDTLEKAARALHPGDWALTFGDAVMFSEDVRSPLGDYPGSFDPGSLYYGFGFKHTTCFVTKRVYDEIGPFDTRYRIAVDTDFLLRCHLRGVEFRQTDAVTYMRTGGMSDRKQTPAFMEYLLQLNRHGFSKPRIARTFATYFKDRAKERARAWVAGLKAAPRA